MQGAGKIPTEDAAGNLVASSVAKKVAVTGAIGGLAVAAAGGNENAIRDGFLRAGAMVLIQEGYRTYTKHAMDVRASKGPPYCVSTTVDCRQPPRSAAVYKNGKFVGWDKSKLDPTAPHVGIGFPDTNITQNAVTWPTEGSPLMNAVSKVPGMNAMAVFHDQWALDWNMPSGVLQATIYPAIVLTYNGTTAPLLEQVRVVAQKNRAKSSATTTTDLQTVTVLSDAVPEAVPIEEERVETSFFCAKKNDTRSILVEVDKTKREFACRVIYRSNQKRTVPWRASCDPSYCASKARALANKQLDWGYDCMVAFATPRVK